MDETRTEAGPFESKAHVIWLFDLTWELMNIDYIERKVKRNGFEVQNC